MSLLELEELSRAFGGVQAVDRVSFGVDTGEVVALIGPNGAGKTTCFNLVNGQLAPDSGRVRIGGEDATGLSPREAFRRGVGRTFQITATFGSMTVRENVQVALLSQRRQLGRFWRAAASAHAEEADALVQRVGLLDQAARHCAVLAYGDLKRLELAMTLAGRPRLLLMDEPTAGMASAERGALMELTARLAEQDGLAVLFTEHDMDVVFRHAQRVLVMDRGRLIAEGAPDAIRADPDVRRVYLGAHA